METILPNELHLLMQAEPNTSVLDVRTPAEYAVLHVPGTRNIPLTALDPRQLLEAGTLSKERPIYLLCKAGNRSRLAAQKFVKEVRLDSVVVEGGVDSWQKSGLPVQRGKSGVISLERQVRIAAGSLVLLGLALAWTVHPWFLGLSAFVGAGLVFAGITDFCGMGLLLARLPWNNRPPA